jgi:hypothetical protein
MTRGTSVSSWLPGHMRTPIRPVACIDMLSEGTVSTLCSGRLGQPLRVVTSEFAQSVMPWRPSRRNKVVDSGLGCLGFCLEAPEVMSDLKASSSFVQIINSIKQRSLGADSPSAGQNFHVLYGTRRFITVFTRARHWTLPWASWIQSTTSRSVSLRPSLMLSWARWVHSTVTLLISFNI